MQGNFIGTNAAGTPAWVMEDLVFPFRFRPSLQSVGQTAGAGNVISANNLGIGFGGVAETLFKEI